jgi:hypothetical protein
VCGGLAAGVSGPLLAGSPLTLWHAVMLEDASKCSQTVPLVLMGAKHTLLLLRVISKLMDRKRQRVSMLPLQRGPHIRGAGEGGRVACGVPGEGSSCAQTLLGGDGCKTPSASACQQAGRQEEAESGPAAIRARKARRGRGVGDCMRGGLGRARTCTCISSGVGGCGPPSSFPACTASGDQGGHCARPAQAGAQDNPQQSNPSPRSPKHPHV